MQIPVTIPQGMSNQSINKITEQITQYAQFLFSRFNNAEKEDSKKMTREEARQYLDSLSIKGVNVPADFNGMKDMCNPKYL